eukprot:m.251352 g.251352  ORF g.251352 m.251352 type:complete len:1189 (+) comp40335_c0_seq4:90-3656(+)
MEVTCRVSSDQFFAYPLTFSWATWFANVHNVLFPTQLRRRPSLIWCGVVGEGIVDVRRNEQSGWWTGKLNGRWISFPCALVEVKQPDGTFIPGGNWIPSSRKCLVIRKYEAQNEGELNLEIGDEIGEIQESGHSLSLWRGRPLLEERPPGLFPADHVVPYPSEVNALFYLEEFMNFPFVVDLSSGNLRDYTNARPGSWYRVCRSWLDPWLPQMFAMTIQDYKVQKKKEIGLRVGDVIRLTDVSRLPGWWKGINLTATGKQSGFFPKQFVRRIRDISSMHDSAKCIFEDARQRGETVVYRARIHLVGKDGAGKTCFKRALLGKKFQEQKSTPGIATDLGICLASTEQFEEGEQWQEIGREEISKLVCDVLSLSQSKSSVSEQRQRESPLAEITSSAEEQQEQQLIDSGDVENLTSQTEAEIELSNSSDAVGGSSNDASGHGDDSGTSQVETVESRQLLAEEIAADSASHLIKLQQDILEDFNDPDLLKRVASKGKSRGPAEYFAAIIWDEGGQEQYLNMQAPFISEDAFNLIVFDSTKDLKKSVKTTKFIEENGITIEQRLHAFKKHGDYITRWLSMICVSAITDSTKSRLSQKFGPHFRRQEYEAVHRLGEGQASPPVFLIGTRADKSKSKSDKNKIQTDLKDLLKGKPLLEKLIVENDSQNLLYFPVELNYANFLENSLNWVGRPLPDHRNVKEVRRRIAMMSKKYWQQWILPTRWFLLELLFNRIGKDLAIVDFDFVRRLAAEVCNIQSESELKLAVSYLAAMGVVIHDEESDFPIIRQKIITNPNWVFEVFAKFLPMLPEPGTPSGYEDKYLGDLKELREKGVMSRKLVEHHLSKIANLQDNQRDLILQFLQQLDILSLSKDKSYHVPCLVQKLSDEEELFISEKKKGCPDFISMPLIFRAKNIGIWPEPLYFRLVTHFLEECKDPSRSAILQRNRNVIPIPDREDPTVASKDIHLELLYEDPLYVVATVKVCQDFHSLYVKENVKKRCRQLRRDLETQIGRLKQLGMKAFEYVLCFHRESTSLLPKRAEKERDLYVDVYNPLDFKVEGSRTIYIKQGNPHTLSKEITDGALYWFGDSAPSSVTPPTTSPVNNWHRFVMPHLRYLIDELPMDDRFLCCLMERGIELIDLHDKEEVSNKKTQMKKVKHLIEKILPYERKGSFEKFCKALRRSGRDDIVEKLLDVEQ